MGRAEEEQQQQQAQAGTGGSSAHCGASCSKQSPYESPYKSPMAWPSSQSGVQINPWSLQFSNAGLEAGFRRHQHTVWRSVELRNGYFNMIVGIINLTITITIINLTAEEGSVFTFQSARIMLPYMTVAVAHWWLVAHWRHWPDYRDAGSFVAEVCYHTICCLSMPTWVLHGVATDLKTFLRLWILGSGILIGYWVRFLTPTFFVTARWLVPLQFLFQAAYLAHPTCAALEASSYGAAAAVSMSRLFDRLAAATLSGAACPVHACEHSIFLLQLLAGCTLLYGSYRMERASRRAFLQGRASVQQEFPLMPAFVQAVLHVVVAVQLLAALWVLMQCSVPPARA